MFSDIKRHIAILFLLISMQILVPPSYLHSLMNHDDTHCVPQEGKNLEKHHHHCEILKIEIPAFVFSRAMEVTWNEARILISDVRISFLTHKISIILPGLRAPPVQI